jgi:formylglycine-generating enzyme required for sulfatase activity
LARQQRNTAPSSGNLPAFKLRATIDTMSDTLPIHPEKSWRGDGMIKAEAKQSNPISQNEGKPAPRPRSMIRYLLLSLLGPVAFGVTYAAVRSTSQPPTGMVWIPGGEFTMGTDDRIGWADEKPAHRVRVDGFWMDETDVTNAQFRAFVEATGYVTTAEKPVDVEEILRQSPPGTPAPPPEKLVPSSLVFQPTSGPVKDFRDVSRRPSKLSTCWRTSASSACSKW